MVYYIQMKLSYKSILKIDQKELTLDKVNLFTGNKKWYLQLSNYGCSLKQVRNASFKGRASPLAMSVDVLLKLIFWCCWY